ncbi:WD repeat-containing protein 62 [Trichonephila inaurata madagascariensis]|uniref:WD repeat-containing protein 62 n=1 Tax=Trichonephila inaurata madagascariensis TaxID=2747483 RepID=A0A8X6WRW5_9ARAC|nr:WD repeat-containing protein 62 [Trichonephila inaurata madagascariensis]
MSSHPPASKYPDVIAITLDETNKKTYPDLPEDSSTLPGGTFFTCASDDTIRIWNLDHKMFQNSALKRNIYCYELLKILYTDPNFVFLCDIDFLPAGTNEKLVNSYDGKNGVRCLKIRPDGQHLASGDRSGNVRVYDLNYLELLCKIEAHDAEVLCLEYSNAESDKSANKSTQKMMWKPSIKVIQEQVVTEKTTFYDMEKDVSQPHVLAACQDSKIRIYDIPAGKSPDPRARRGADLKGRFFLIRLQKD